MPYSQVTAGDFIQQIQILMDDPSGRYWGVDEVKFALWEALNVWGAYTNYWRERGSFSVGPSTPYYDLSEQLPLLRSRALTLDQMVREIQYMLLESANGISGTNMSGQVDVQSILLSIRDARNRLVIDSKLPISYHSTLGDPSPVSGLVTFDQSSVYVHRAGWVDSTTGLSNNLWRQDLWAIDKGMPGWVGDLQTPTYYSEAELAPLKLQLAPPPNNSGVIEALTVDSLLIDLDNQATTFDIPDEWFHAMKYAALSQILGSEGQIKDQLRSSYAEQRYQQALQFARNAASIIRLMINNQPLNIDSLVSADAGYPMWRNQSGSPILAGVLYDFIVMIPGVLDGTYGVTADVVRSAPLPDLTDFIQIGAESLDSLKDYVCHVLTFKCGGQEFKDSISGYDSYMSTADSRKRINKAKVQYLQPLFQQPQAEWGARPDKEEA